VRTYLDLKVSGVEVIQPFQEDLVQNCNLFGEKKNEREKKMVEGCTKYLPAAGRQSTRYQDEYQVASIKKQDFNIPSTKYQVPSTFRSAI
jgi:hypothetical protein